MRTFVKTATAVLVIGIFLSAAQLAYGEPSVPALNQNARNVTVACTTNQPTALPCNEEAKQKCGGDFQLVTIVSSQRVPVNPIDQGNALIWRYVARYRCPH